jgi:cytochrome o ubiquinol oxidase subunit 1
MKRRGYVRPTSGFAPIHMPKNTAAGPTLAGLSVVCAVGLIWYIWWLAALSFIVLLIVAIGHTFNYDRDFNIPAQAVLTVEDARTATLLGGLNP